MIGWFNQLLGRSRKKTKDRSACWCVRSGGSAAWRLWNNGWLIFFSFSLCFACESPVFSTSWTSIVCESVDVFIYVDSLESTFWTCQHRTCWWVGRAHCGLTDGREKPPSHVCLMLIAACPYIRHTCFKHLCCPSTKASSVIVEIPSSRLYVAM